MTKNWILIISSVLVLPFNLFIFLTVSSNYGAGPAFLFGCIFYWLYISLILLLLNKDGSLCLARMVSSDGEFHYAELFKAATFLPAVSAFFAVFMPFGGRLTLITGLIVLGISIVNGAIEEIYWRGLYLKVFKDEPYIILIVSPLLFALMHCSFLAIKGMAYQGGAFALVGGSLFMGLLWSYLSFKLKSIRYSIAAHICVNIFAFTGLFIENDLFRG